MFQIANPCVLESLSLVVYERANRATQGNYGNGGRRFEARNHADQVTESK